VSEGVSDLASPEIEAPSAPEWSCTVTSYVGHEDELLRLRNSNRAHAVTREYLDWRYAHDDDAPEPRIFWLVASAGQPIGVAAAIFRAYWVAGVRTHVAVIGDISLDPAWRGRGLGQLLLQKMTEALSADGRVALVLPTEAARKSFQAIGWTTIGELTPRVLLCDVTGRLRRIVRIDSLAATLGRAFKAVMRARLRKSIDPSCELQIVSQPDASFDVFWNALPKRDRVLRDISSRMLAWRYQHHPHTRFEVARLMRGSNLAGFLVFNLAPHYATCFIYDLVASSEADARCLMALFAVHCMTLDRLDVIRIVLEDKHPYAPMLRALGFLRREPRVPLQVYPATAARDAWVLSLGDKDV
jgi:GNAT superfamily N-acetyltransferase